MLANSLCKYGVVLTLLVFARSAVAQWTEQVFLLDEGWNAIYLELDPALADADQLFAHACRGNCPFYTVWSPREMTSNDAPPCQDPSNPACAVCNDINNPACVPLLQSNWQVWLPANRGGSFLSTLRIVRGGRALLIESAARTTLTIVGTPNGDKTSYREGFNLTGFHVSSHPAPTFHDFLAPAPILANTKVFTKQSNGTLAQISDLTNSAINAGRSYWVKANAAAIYDGPISIDDMSLRGIDFAQSLVDHWITIENKRTENQNVEIRFLSSASPPLQPSGLPTLAGQVPLRWLDVGSGNSANEVFQWRDLVAEPSNLELQSSANPASRRSVRMAASRSLLSEAVVDTQGHGAQYQGILEVAGESGFVRLIPVRAQVPSRSGLYVGTVTVNQVAWVTAGAPTWNGDDPVAPEITPGGACADGPNAGQPCSSDGNCPSSVCTMPDTANTLTTPAEFQFRVILHKDNQENHKLLTEVTMMFKPGEGSNPGHYVLATSECPPQFCSTLEPAGLVNGQPFARRISTAAFSFPGDLLLNGTLSSSLAGEVLLPENDPRNPFRHFRHPDHDCDQEGECVDITRQFAMVFSAEQTGGDVNPGFGFSALSGIYTETISGLYKQPINVRGRFNLTRVSDIPILNN